MDSKHVLDLCTLDYYVNRQRYVIIIQFHSKPGYILWDYAGKEQHRIVLASSHFFSGDAITFDNELPIAENSDLLWINCKVTENDFCNLVGTDFNSIKASFDKYVTNWYEVLTRVQPNGK